MTWWLWLAIGWGSAGLVLGGSVVLAALIADTEIRPTRSLAPTE